MERKIRNIIWVEGDRYFHYQHGELMSYSRHRIQEDLKNGFELMIRQATSDEIGTLLETSML